MKKKTVIIICIAVAVIAIIAYVVWRIKNKSSEIPVYEDKTVFYTEAQEALIAAEMAKTPYNREEAIQILQAAGKI